MVRALVPSHDARRRAVAQRAVAVAFVGKLYPGQGEALRGAEGCAHPARHVRGRRGRAGQRAAIRAFGDTAELRPARGDRDLSRYEAWRRRVRVGACWLRDASVPEGVAAGENRERGLEARRLVDNFRLENAGIRRGLIDRRGKRRAVHEVPVRVWTVIDGVLKEVYVPSVREVAVMSISGRVPVREDPSAVAPIVELVDGDEHFVEQGDEMNWVTIGAIARVESLNRVRHVRLVVGGVEVDSVPARREEDLRAQAVRTVVIKEAGALGPIRVIGVSAAEVYGEG